MSNLQVHQVTLRGNNRLTNVEIDLIDRINATEREVLKLVHEVESLLNAQAELVDTDRKLAKRCYQAEPGRLHNLAKTSLQVGFMHLVRAVSQPQSTYETLHD